jgi:hypothetical protein
VGPIPILTRIGGRAGAAAVQMTMVGSAIMAGLVTTVASVDPVTTVASVGLATMAEATMAEAAATTKPLPAQMTGAARALLDPEHRVDLVAHDDAARVRVSLGRVEMVHHVGVADPILQVDETE